MSRSKRIRSHLSSWVMLPPSSTTSLPYTPLPGETTLFTSPPRISFALTSPSSSHPGSKSQPPFALSHAAGIAYLTSRRLIYLPSTPTDKLQSFAAPILNLHDSHVTAPFFGPNVWTAVLQPVVGGGIPGPVELRLTFKEGGAFDFHTVFERVKERLGQAAEVQGTSARDVDNLEDLPAYVEESEGPLIAPTAAGIQTGAAARGRDGRVDERRNGGGAEVPYEPPPGYEEAQMAGLQDEMARRESEGR